MEQTKNGGINLRRKGSELLKEERLRAWLGVKERRGETVKVTEAERLMGRGKERASRSENPW